MKYDRPVWQLMHACADAMPEVFRYDHVRAWFGQNFPEVGDATLRAHVVGLTEGGTKHSQFRRRSPIFRRVARGEYAPIPIEERGESPDDVNDEQGPALVRFRAAGSVAVDRADEPESPSGSESPSARTSEAIDRVTSPEGAADLWPFPPDVGSGVSEPDLRAFEHAEASRLAFEQEMTNAAREAAEREQLEKEEIQLRRTLHPLRGDVPAGDPDDSSGPGGIVIVRAPSRPQPSGSSTDDAVPPRGARDLGEPETADAIVLGSLGDLDDRLAVPAPARDAFRDLGFRRARRAAEVSGARWFVLSADHGLLEPTDWMSPEDAFDATIQPRHRAAWAAWVVARLESLVGSLEDLVVQVEAPDEMGLPVISALLDAGAAATTGPVHAPAPAVAPLDDLEQHGAAVRSAGPDLRFARAPSVAGRLADAGRAVGATAAAALPEVPGVYAWLVDQEGARVLNRALMLPVRAGVIFVGQVGPGDAGVSLRDQIARVQLQGRARSSTFRMTLATALSGPLGLQTMDDPLLLQWMVKHLSVSVWPADDANEVPQLTDAVTGLLRPPLNLDHVGAQEYRRRLVELGARIG